MKKVLLFVAVISAFSFASCKKDYACKCTSGGVSVEGSTFNDTKKNAEAECDKGDTSLGGITIECEAVKK